MDTIKVAKEESPSIPEVIEINEENEVKEVFNNAEIVEEKLQSQVEIQHSDMSIADYNYDQPIPKEVSNKDLIEVLQPVFDDYNKKYGTELVYDDLKSFINFAAFAKQSDAAIKEVINGKLITDACDYVIFKGIMVAAKVIDGQLNAIQNRSFTENITVEAMTVVTSIFDWMEKLESFKKKYKQYNIEGKIANIIKDQNKANSRESTVDDLKLIDLLRLSLKSPGGKDAK